MVTHLLDTDVLSLHQVGHPKVSPAIVAQAPGTVGLAVISVAEVLTGWHALLARATGPPELARVYGRLARGTTLLGRFPILNFTEPAIDRFEQLVRLRLDVGKNDLRIAAIALESGCAVVTRNERDFCRVPGLEVENWAS